MKKIEMIIKPFKLDEVRDVLEDEKVDNIIITDVRLFGQKSDKSSLYEEGEYVIDALPKIKLECCVEDDQVDQIVAAVSAAMDNGRKDVRKGDGSLAIYDVLEWMEL